MGQKHKELLGYHDMPECVKNRAYKTINVIRQLGITRMIDYGQNEFVYIHLLPNIPELDLLVIDLNRTSTAEGLNYRVVCGNYNKEVFKYLQSNTLYTYYLKSDKLTFNNIRTNGTLAKLLKSGITNSYLIVSSVDYTTQAQEFKLFSLSTGEDITDEFN